MKVEGIKGEVHMEPPPPPQALENLGAEGQLVYAVLTHENGKPVVILHRVKIDWKTEEYMYGDGTYWQVPVADGIIKTH